MATKLGQALIQAEPRSVRERLHLSQKRLARKSAKAG
jgi:hypothetical protein